MTRDRLIKPFSGSILIAVFFLLNLIFLPAITSGQEVKKNLPLRKITVAPEYPRVEVVKGEDVDLNLVVRNGGRQGETIDLFFTSIPKGWKAWFKTYSFKIGGVYVESDSTKNVSIEAKPGKGVVPGRYRFPITAKTSDGRLVSSSELIITVSSEKEMKKAGGINITTSYPVLKGPTDGKFEFSLDVENKTDKDAIFNLSYDAPKDWGINFKPSYEDKYFSSLRIKKNQSKSLAVEVKPYVLAEPGLYPIKVKISSDKAQNEVVLKVDLTGTYKMDVGTADGLLSLNAYQGKIANRSFYVKNSGSATDTGIKFISFKPENWKVTFTPKKIDSLAPGELKQVEMTITPADQALVGDYSVAVNVNGQKLSKNLEFRVTVKASTAWGWIGLIIILMVLAGLVFLFLRMGRRSPWKVTK